MRKLLLSLALTFGLAHHAAAFNPCDYLSAGALMAAVPAAAKAAGFYAIQNATTGAMMLGSTLPGASAAGTVGIIGGTAGTIGTIGATLLTPSVLVPAAAVAVAAGGAALTCHVLDRQGMK